MPWYRKVQWANIGPATAILAAALSFAGPLGLLIAFVALCIGYDIGLRVDSGRYLGSRARGIWR